MAIAEAPTRRPEATPTPERLSFHEGLVGLHARLLLEGNALNPRVDIAQVEQGAIRSFGVRASEVNGAYALANRASKGERQEYWQRQNIDGFDAQKQAWIDQTVGAFNNNPRFWDSEKGKAYSQAISRIGIDTKTFSREQAEAIYNRYFGKENKDIGIQIFVRDVIESYMADGKLDYQQLHQDLPVWQWLTRIFGDEYSPQIVAQFTDAEARLFAAPQQLVEAANAQETVANEQKARVNNLRREEIDLLNFLSQKGQQNAYEAEQSSPQPRTDNSDRRNGPQNQDEVSNSDGESHTDEIPQHPDWEKLRTRYRSNNEAFWKNMTQIRKIVSPSKPVQQDLPVYYPGASADIAYPLGTSDAQNFVFVDFLYVSEHPAMADYSTGANRQIVELGGTITSVKGEGILGQNGKRIITFDWGGKERKITMYAEDATKFTPEEIKNGTSYIVVKAPTPASRTGEFEDDPGYIWSPESKIKMIRELSVDGFIQWEPTIELPAETVGLQSVLPLQPTIDDRRYRNGYPLYKKTQEEPQLDKIILFDNHLTQTLAIRDGVLIITENTLPITFMQELQELHQEYEALTGEKRKQLLPTLRDLLNPQTITDEQKKLLYQFGREYGITDEQKVRAYMKQANEIAQKVFPEIQEETI